MNISNEGGYVYPQGQSGNPYLRGITRRDWLAGLAMQGMLANPESINQRWSSEDMAHMCYINADAVIAEGRRGGE